MMAIWVFRQKYRYDSGKHGGRAEGEKLISLGLDWNRTRSKALGDPHLTRHCFVPEDANWVQQSMSFVFSCQHFSERLCPIVREELLTKLPFLVAMIIAVSSWKGRINCNFEKKKCHYGEVFKCVAKHRYLSKKNWQGDAPLACIKKKKLYQSEQRDEISFSVTV